MVSRDERLVIGRDCLCRLAEGAAELRDHLVVRIDVEIGDRSEIHAEAEIRHLARHAGVELLRLRGRIVRRDGRGIGQFLEPDGLGQPLDRAAFLVERDERRQVR